MPTPTPNMNLTLPVVSTTPGPLWANEINQDLNTIDQHNHTTGFGAKVPTAGLDINGDLSFANNAAINLLGTSFFDVQGNTPSLTRVLYSEGVDLWFRDGSGNSFPITSGGAVAGTPGSINGLPSGTAAVNYLSGSGTFQFLQSTNQSAILDVGPLLVRTTTSSSNGVTITPASGTTNWTLTLPSAVPASTSLLTVDTSGSVIYKSLSSNQQIGSTTTGSTSFATWTALASSITLVTTGNPVVISMTADATGSDGSITLTPASSSGKMKAWLKVVIDGSVDAGSQIFELQAPSSGYLQLPLSSYSAFVLLSAGSHTFRLYGKTQASGGGYVTTTIGVSNARFYVYEL